jgi:integrase
MGMGSGNPRHDYQGEVDRIERAAGNSITQNDADAILEFLRAKDREDRSVENDTTDYLGPSSLYAYGQKLRLIAKRSEVPLADITADQFDDLMESFLDGSHPNVRDSGLSQAYVIQGQSAARVFYRYHDLNRDAEAIWFCRRPKPEVDERDMFTKKEIQAMRDAISNSRDRCLFELLLNTGQRVRAIQTLRLKDVNLNEGVYWLNKNVDGLKGASGKRPLLGAKSAVFEWLKDHPKSDDPNAYLITIMPSSVRGTPGEQIHQTQINTRLKKIAKESGVTKPVNAHNFRHAFVTMAKRDYDMKEDTIRHLIGHREGSNVMETTYKHLTDDDYVKDAEISAGFRQPENESPLSPPICPTCSENLAPSAKACPKCGNVFTPDAKAVKDDIESDLWDSKGEADTPEEITGVDTLRDYIEEHPQALPALLAEYEDGAEGD